MDKLVHRNRQVFSIIRPSVKGVCLPSGNWNVSHLLHHLWGTTAAVVKYVDGKTDVGTIAEQKDIRILGGMEKYSQPSRIQKYREE